MKKKSYQLILGLSFLIASIGMSGKQNYAEYKPFQYFSIMTQDTTAKKYLEELNNPDPAIRSNAAHQLCIMKHPKAVAACIKTINDLENINHLDYTPSVSYLIEMGEPALLPLLDAVSSGDETTRLRICTAIERITYNVWVDPKTKDKSSKEKKWKKWWATIDLKYNGNKDEREAAVNRLKEWLKGRKK